MRSRTLWGWIIAAGFAALLLWAWPWLRPAFTGGVRAAADLLGSAGGYGPLVVIGLQMLQAILAPLPSWPVTVAAGALYGPVPGTFYSLVGGMLGAAINFSISRRFGQPFVLRRFGQAWVDRAALLRPLHFLVLSLFGRLIPIASFDAVAYVAGISRISLPTFLGAALLGQAPAFLAYALFGSDIARAQSAGLWSSLLLLLFIGLIFGGRWLWHRLLQPPPR